MRNPWEKRPAAQAIGEAFHQGSERQLAQIKRFEYHGHQRRRSKALPQVEAEQHETGAAGDAQQQRRNDSSKQRTSYLRSCSCLLLLLRVYLAFQLRVGRDDGYSA